MNYLSQKIRNDIQTVVKRNNNYRKNTIKKI